MRSRGSASSVLTSAAEASKQRLAEMCPIPGDSVELAGRHPPTISRWAKTNGFLYFKNYQKLGANCIDLIVEERKGSRKADCRLI